jgi:subtilisin family serine protease
MEVEMSAKSFKKEGALTRDDIERLIYGPADQQRRFTQDFPILPDVWISYAENTGKHVELLLTPFDGSTTAAVASALRKRIDADEGTANGYHAGSEKEAHPKILFNDSVVLADFTFEELIRLGLPLTAWWTDYLADSLLDQSPEVDLEVSIKTLLESPAKERVVFDKRLLKKLISLVGALKLEQEEPGYLSEKETGADMTPEETQSFMAMVRGAPPPRRGGGLIHSISCNRKATTSVWRSRLAVKADAAARLFDVDTTGIRWAVLDVGVDATHPAFKRRKRADRSDRPDVDEQGREQFSSRVIRTYDFLRLKPLLNPRNDFSLDNSYAALLPKERQEEIQDSLRSNLKGCRPIDWGLLEPLLRVPHRDEEYAHYRSALNDSHGTHVAGIIAANWPEAESTGVRRPLCGICPDLELFDIRVLGRDKYGKDADEFSIIGALQFIRYLNAHRDLLTIHGVNLSLSVVHDVANYACGRTPICEECERVVANGVVVVTAAGNRGFNKFAGSDASAMGDYRFISITDPGNSENVITVGSTHRFMPHNYGVSYFSSRGPTGDGRIKPDLVAPGERIDSCALNDDFETMDGTSMAAPHVSGAAALLLSRHRELIGQPKRVKEILCRSATDLGREPHFQGAGMLDALRALQSV